MDDQHHMRRRILIGALLLSALLHVAFFAWLRVVATPVQAARAPAASIDLTIEETEPKPPPAPEAVQAAPVPVPSTRGHAQAKAAPVAAPIEGVEAAAAPGASTDEESASARATEIPHKLDLTLHRPMEMAPSGGETFHNLPGEGLPEDHLPSLAQSRIEGWIDTDSSRRRVEKGLVDDWFMGLRDSLDRALAKNPPPAPGAGTLARQMADGYLASASAYGKTGTPGEPSGPDTSVSAPAADIGAAGGIIPFSRPRLTLGAAGEKAAGLWAIIEIQYDPTGKLSDSKVLSSSGNHSFDSHVIKVVALGLPGLPDLPDGGLGIHPNGTRSVWEVDGHVSFERDLKTVGLKDAWYLPLAAVTALAGAGAGAFDEVSGYVGFTDLRHAHLKCDVKLLQVY